MNKKIGIICAMESELEPILKDMVVDKEVSKAGMTFYEGLLNKTPIVAVQCGIAKVNAAVCTQIIITEFGVTHVLNSGVAGGTRENIYPLDVVISNDLVQHDVDASAFGRPLGQVPGLSVFSFKCDDTLVKIALEASKDFPNINFHVGRIVSGDQFIYTKEKLEFLRDTFMSMATEMEGAAIAQVCYLNRIPFIVLRSISDNAINGEVMEYEKFYKIASINSYQFTRKFIELFNENDI